MYFRGFILCLQVFKVRRHTESSTLLFLNAGLFSYQSKAAVSLDKQIRLADGGRCTSGTLELLLFAIS